jgi:hypothetical protein
VNENPDELAWNGMDPRLRLATVPNLDGLIAVRPPADVPAPAAGYIHAYIVDASASDTVATMMLIIPQDVGRDLDDLDIVERDGAQWTRFGSYMHQPLASVPVLPRGATEVVTIGPEGYAEWRAVASDVTPVQVTITTTGAWHLYDPAFTTVANGKKSAVTSLACRERARLPDTLRRPGADHNGGGAVIEHRSSGVLTTELPLNRCEACRAVKDRLGDSKPLFFSLDRSRKD